MFFSSEIYKASEIPVCSSASFREWILLDLMASVKSAVELNPQRTRPLYKLLGRYLVCICQDFFFSPQQL